MCITLSAREFKLGLINNINDLTGLSFPGMVVYIYQSKYNALMRILMAIDIKPHCICNYYYMIYIFHANVSCVHFV